MCGVPRVQPNMSRLLATALSLVLLLGACGEAGSERGGELGTIQGVVLLGPVCPVETETSPCPDEPLSGVEVVAVDQDGHETTAVSGSDGRFSMDVSPGEFTLHAVVDQDGIRSSKPVDLTVGPGQTVEVTVPVDSGIR